MVRTVQVPGDQIEVHGDHIEVHARVGAGQITGAVFTIQENSPDAPNPLEMSFEEWERNFNEIIKLAPTNQYPCDDSREAMYGPDPGEVESD